MSQVVSSQVVINIPRDAAWAKLRDISVAHYYVPGIVKTEIVSEQQEGLGASRYVYRNAKSYIQETVTEWNEGSGFLIKLHKGDKPAPPFKSASFTYLLEDGELGTTRFTASMEFELPWGGFGQWLEKRLAGFVGKTIADVALSMKLYYESGEATTSARLKAHKSGKA
jgi:Polyketide cyclase / dehydrase and lipid transport